MKVLTALGLCLTMTALLAGCSKPENAIVGKWKSADKFAPLTFEFFKDGTVSNGNLSGKYSFPDATHIQMSNGVVSDVKAFKIEGDTLTLTDDLTSNRQPATELHRVKE